MTTLGWMGKGARVQVLGQMKKPKHFGKCGVITHMDRGNVYVTLADGTEICTRMTMLGPAPEPSPLAVFVKEATDG